jgi:septal ring factor EnvC (AmiA/AmiB activator)
MDIVRFLFLFIINISFFSAFSQESIEDIRKKQEKAKKEIIYLNTLLKNTQSSQSKILESLLIINEKVKNIKELLLSLADEVNLLDYLISENKNKQLKLDSDRRNMLDLYAKLVYETWKKKDNQMNKITFILSSTNFLQAYVRYRYFKQIQDYSKQQIHLIKQTNDSLQMINNRLTDLLLQKNNTQITLSQQNNQLSIEMNRTNNIVEQLKKEQQNINKKLKIEIKNEEKYRIEIEKLIRRQITSSGSSSSNQKLTPEEKLISNDFVKNKGRLPWPVAKGFTSEKYGINYWSSPGDVKIENKGITITTSAKEEVRAVFAGKVMRIVLFPGKNNGILIRHGEKCWTFYDNLVELYVKEGDIVKGKQKIGRLPVDKSGNSSFNFQVWNGKNHEDPCLWLSK